MFCPKAVSPRLTRWVSSRRRQGASTVADKPGCACRVDAGKVELDGARYLNFNLPFSISQLVWIEAILVGGAEIYRNRELDPEARIYPGALAL